jgi:hypothetical protein
MRASGARWLSVVRLPLITAALCSARNAGWGLPPPLLRGGGERPGADTGPRAAGCVSSVNFLLIQGAMRIPPTLYPAQPAGPFENRVSPGTGAGEQRQGRGLAAASVRTAALLSTSDGVGRSAQHSRARGPTGADAAAVRAALLFITPLRGGLSLRDGIAL